MQIPNAGSRRGDAVILTTVILRRDPQVDVKKPRGPSSAGAAGSREQGANEKLFQGKPDTNLLMLVC